MEAKKLPKLKRYNGSTKSVMCKQFIKNGRCEYENKCWFAHGEQDLHLWGNGPKYKTKRCKRQNIDGSCWYGSRCWFIHDDENTSESDQESPKSRSGIEERKREKFWEYREDEEDSYQPKRAKTEQEKEHRNPYPRPFFLAEQKGRGDIFRRQPEICSKEGVTYKDYRKKWAESEREELRRLAEEHHHPELNLRQSLKLFHKQSLRLMSYMLDENASKIYVRRLIYGEISTPRTTIFDLQKTKERMNWKVKNSKRYFLHEGQQETLLQKLNREVERIKWKENWQIHALDQITLITDVLYPETIIHALHKVEMLPWKKAEEYYLAV